MTVTAALIGEFGFCFASRRLLTALRGVVIFGALFTAVLAACRLTLLFVWQVRVQFVLLGVVGGIADGWLRGLLAHDVEFLKEWQ